MQTFENYIQNYLREKYGNTAEDLFNGSLLLQYIVYKTKSANSNSKARSSFANLYAIYVLVEDYLNKGFDKNHTYNQYEGAQFATLFNRQRELPFGAKLQNHALNSRMNEEFYKYFPQQKALSMSPIIRDLSNGRYWFNEKYLIVHDKEKSINIAKDIIAILDNYIQTKKNALESFIEQCNKLQNIEGTGKDSITEFITSLLSSNVDARLFEIVSYAIMKNYYKETIIYWGYSREQLTQEPLSLYKTGRTNANDGGIDFVMRPLGKFFQVTETTDFRKYFLDIEKIERYPISFVVKTDKDSKELKAKIKEDANSTYGIDSIVDKYLHCIEDVINIPILKNYLQKIVEKDDIESVLSEIILQSKVEFNYPNEELE